MGKDLQQVRMMNNRDGKVMSHYGEGIENMEGILQWTDE